jgi:hypothetical protein
MHRRRRAQPGDEWLVDMIRTKKRSYAELLACLLAFVPMCAAWLIPGEKDAAVAGRLGYLQFMLLLATAAIGVSAVAVIMAGESRRRAWLGSTVLLWLGSGLALGIGEAAAWAWPTRHLMDNPWYQATGEAMTAARDLPYQRPPYLQWTGLSRGDLAMDDDEPDPSARTVTFATDSEGFRNEDGAGPSDIVFLGDSFTEAGNAPVGETFPALVGMRTGCRIRNLGVAGFAPPTELIVLRNFGLRRMPGTVVWQIAESNDLTDSWDFSEWVKKGRPDFRQGIPGIGGPLGMPTRLQGWERRSPTRRLFDLLRRPKPWPVRGTFRDASGAEHDVRFEETLPGPDQSSALHPGWAVMRAALHDGGQILAERKIDLVVVMIPMKFRALAESMRFDRLPVDRPGRGRVLIDTWPTEFDLPVEQVMAHHLDELCREMGATFVDTTAALKRQAAGGELGFLPMDTHLSPAGHRLVATLIAEAIMGREPTCRSRARRAKPNDRR